MIYIYIEYKKSWLRRILLFRIYSFVEKKNAWDKIVSVKNSVLNQKPELSTQSDLARKRDIHIQTVLYLSESRLWETTFMGNFLKYLKSLCLD